MEEDFKVIDNYLMVKMPQEIDHHKSSYISENADRFIVRENVSNVVFDFEDTRFMDSSGIGIIMGRYKKISCFGGKVFAIHADHRIRRLLMLSQYRPMNLLPGWQWQLLCQNWILHWRRYRI